MITNSDYAIFFHNNTLLANGDKKLFIIPFSEVYRSHGADMVIFCWLVHHTLLKACTVL